MLRTRHSASAPPAREGQAPHAASFQHFLQSKVDKWHWPAAVLISMGVIFLLSQAVPGEMFAIPGSLRLGGIDRSDSSISISIRLQELQRPSEAESEQQERPPETEPEQRERPPETEPEQQERPPMNEFEEQLYGCRSLKSGPIPFVDTEASLQALESHTPKQRQQAEAYTAAVAACDSFECLHQANKLPRAPGQFRFPHFMVIGFPKCATTSIYCHLIQHPQVQHPKQKESHWLTGQCERQSMSCSADSQQHYLTEILNLPEAAQYQFTKAAFEGSTHYVLEADWMAEQLAATFPWLRVVISLRDPISQAIAMHLHNVMHNREMKCTKDGNETSIYHCIRRALKLDSRSHYPSKIARWMEFFPREQLHFVQYENLTNPDSMGSELTGLKSFLGVDPALPSSQLPLTNYKHVHTGNGPDALGRYWVMKRWELEHLVQMARDNTEETIRLLGKNGFAGPQEKVQWLRNWERVWQDNLGRCEEGRAAPCKVIVS